MCLAGGRRLDAALRLVEVAAGLLGVVGARQAGRRGLVCRLAQQQRQAGQRLAANKLEDIIGAIPQYIWIGPWEDLQIKDA